MSETTVDNSVLNNMRIGSMDDAVARQQEMLASILDAQLKQAEVSRAERLTRYLRLLGSPLQLVDPAVAEEFSSLVTQFYRPRNYEEAGLILDAGGVTNEF